MFDYYDDRNKCLIYNTGGGNIMLKTPQMQYAQAYVPFQRFESIFPPEKALMHGTVFPELFQPYQKKWRLICLHLRRHLNPNTDNNKYKGENLKNG